MAYTILHTDICPEVWRVRVRALVVEDDNGEYSDYGEALARATEINANYVALEGARILGS